MGTKHARHNERLCDHLNTLNDFYDWVVTTAFYTALHYVEGRIFPMPGNPSYPDFDTYWDAQKEFLQCSKHKAMSRLVRNKLPLAAKAYNALMDSCNNARYKNYEVEPDEAKIARERMAFVKAECLKS
jgi:hypothetical protein